MHNITISDAPRAAVENSGKLVWVKDVQRRVEMSCDGFA
jgi:hypothetical protein